MQNKPLRTGTNKVHLDLGEKNKGRAMEPLL